MAALPGVTRSSRKDTACLRRASEPWHAASVHDVFARLDGGAGGLTSGEAVRRARAHGRNEMPATAPRSRLAMLAGQFQNLPTALLAGSAGLSALLRDIVDAGSVLSVVGLNGAIGYAMERRSEELLASWRKLQAGTAEVLRDGRIRRIDAADLVPGDVLLVRAGEIVPADARVLEAHRLSCDEAPLTGESEPRAKDPAPVRRGAPLAERNCMLFAGTRVGTGHGRVAVVATGGETEVARLRTLVEEQQRGPTPLERRMARLTNGLAWAGIGAGALSAASGLLRGHAPATAVRSAVALGIAAMPEGLPVTSVAALVDAMRRMRARGVVVRRLSAAETLGGITVLCVDKTGTLTTNDMRLSSLVVDGRTLPPAALLAVASNPLGDPVSAALAAGVLTSDVDVAKNGHALDISGSSTEKALVLAANDAGLDRAGLRARFPRRVLRERDGGRHYVASLHGAPGGSAVAFMKGAPEQVLELCTRDERDRPMDRSRRESILRANSERAGAGCRVLALAWRKARAGSPQPPRAGYTFVGLAALRDPLRDGAPEAIRRAAKAGIRTVILTGDQQSTALAIARDLGIRGEALDGAEIEAAAANGVAALDGVAVLSRVAPADKVAIVQALRARGEVVAMVGDGVNDAPALKAADVGVAVGMASSDLARQAADVVLEKPDLGALVAAIAEGRVVQDNLRRAVRFLVASNAAEVALVLGGSLLSGRDPLSPRQLLWVNLLSDTLPALGLALEPGRTGVLDRPPARPDAPLLGAGALRTVARDGVLLAALAGAALAVGGPAAAFQAMSASEIGYALACRAPGQPLDPRSAQLFAAGGVLQLATLFLWPLRRVLGLPAAVSGAELGSFGIGIAAPLLAAAFRDDVIIREPGFQRPVRARRNRQLRPPREVKSCVSH